MDSRKQTTAPPEQASPTRDQTRETESTVVSNKRSPSQPRHVSQQTVHTSRSGRISQPTEIPHASEVARTEICAAPESEFCASHGKTPSGHIASSTAAEAPESVTISTEINPIVDGKPDPGITTSPLSVGMLIDNRYEILDIIGEGGFATIYYAHDTVIDREVAIKVMDLKKGTNAGSVERFFREAKAAAKIQHSNVVSIYDYGHIEATGQPYIAMELLRGHTLCDELTQTGPLSPKRAFKLFRPVLEALSVGHQLGIIHKDLKPENLYIVDPCGPREAMKILDFGVACLQTDTTRLTTDGQLLGTPRYLAPEYIRSQTVSAAIDVYQMALIISESLTGVPAATGEFYQVMMLHCSGQLQIGKFLLSGAVGEVFQKALAVDPANRYPDCDSFGKALDSVASYFSSEIPICANDTQLTPGVQNISGNLNISLSAIPDTPKAPNGSDKPGQASPSGISSQPEALEYAPTVLRDAPPSEFFEPSNADSDHKKRLLLSSLGVILLILILILIFITRSHANREEEPLISGEAVETAPDTVAFLFKTFPPGASVLRNGIHPVCQPTPCKADFNISDLNLSQLIVFKLDGYQDATYELKETSYKETDGTIQISMEAEKVASKVLEFLITYTPEHAIVTDQETAQEVCHASPCSYIFDIERGYAELKFEAPGYQSKTENIIKRRYEETDGMLQVTLEKQSKAVKPAKSAAGSTADKLCRKAAKAKVEGKICESVTLYREAKKAGITDATCKRNAETTLAANGSKCK